MSSAVAPFLGGWLLQAGSWRPIFLINIPVAALVPVTVVTMLLSGPSGQLATRIGPRPPLVAGCLLCAAASLLAVRVGVHAGYWTVVFPLAVPSAEYAPNDPADVSSSPESGPAPRAVMRLIAPPSELGPSSDALPLNSSTRST